MILFSIPTDFVLNFSGVTTVIYGPYTGKKDNFISKLCLKQTLFFRLLVMTGRVSDPDPVFLSGSGYNFQIYLDPVSAPGSQGKKDY